MNLFQSGSTKYILLQRIKLHLGEQVEIFRRGEICEELNPPVPLVPSGFKNCIFLFDRSRGLKFLCPDVGAARLTGAEDKKLVSIINFEDRYRAFKQGNRFDHPAPEAGSKVFVEVGDREFPGVDKDVYSPFGPYAEFKVEIEGYYITPTEASMFSGENICGLAPNDNAAVMASKDKLRPRYETNAVPWYHIWIPARYLCRPNRFIPLEFSSFGKENLPVGIIGESNNGFPWIGEPSKRNHESTMEQVIKVEPFDSKSNEFPPKTKRFDERGLKLSQQRVQELKTALDEERRAHEQTKESLKESLTSIQKALEEKKKKVISMKQKLDASVERKLTEEETSKEVLEKQEDNTADELYEIQGKLASEQKAKEEAEKRLQTCEEKIKELEKTLAEVQKLVKRKQKPDNECEWILNREEIHLTNEELGSGAFGTVYKGTFRGTQVAVKQVSVKPIITEYNLENFKREMKMAARCRHPCMLQFIGATSDDQSPLLVTELLDTSLKVILLERPLDPIEIKTISMDVAKGLNYLHLNQPHPIVHRDISSSNLLLWKHDQSWRGKISDYGNAVLMNYARTGSGGALPYLAPEMSNQRFSTKSDVYSYGVLLLEMCLRKAPSCLDDKDEFICLVEDGKMRNLIRSCLQRNPKQRPSMEEVLATLESISELTGNK